MSEKPEDDDAAIQGALTAIFLGCAALVLGVGWAFSLVVAGYVLAGLGAALISVAVWYLVEEHFQRKKATKS